MEKMDNWIIHVWVLHTHVTQVPAPMHMHTNAHLCFSIHIPTDTPMSKHVHTFTKHTQNMHAIHVHAETHIFHDTFIGTGRVVIAFTSVPAREHTCTHTLRPLHVDTHVHA